MVMNGPIPIMLVMFSAVAWSRPKRRSRCGGDDVEDPEVGVTGRQSNDRWQPVSTPRLTTRVKHVQHDFVKTITVRDLRQRWPEAERALQSEGEMVVTRDGRPVARLLPVRPARSRRPTFDPEAHRRWQVSLFGRGRVVSLSDRYLAVERGDRNLSSAAKRPT